MGDRETLAKAKRELEDLYLGVPDDSVNLTFQDLAQVRKTLNTEKSKKSSSPSSATLEQIPEKNNPSGTLGKIPSLDFSKGLQAASFQSTTKNNNDHYDDHYQRNDHNIRHNLHGRPHEGNDTWDPRGHHAYGRGQGRSMHAGDHHERSVANYDDMSYVSGMRAVAYGGGGERGGRRRPGIPHSNICTVCSTYIYICRHRCLVCGRVYCRQCVGIGMGEMTEGRKCIECLGRRFSPRYIQKAGNVGCCLGYPSTVKQQELKWAEKGPRRSGENIYGGHSAVASRPRSPVGPSTPTKRSHNFPSASNPPSFVMNSPYSPYSPTNHHPLPF